MYIRKNNYIFMLVSIWSLCYLADDTDILETGERIRAKVQAMIARGWIRWFGHWGYRSSQQNLGA